MIEFVRGRKKVHRRSKRKTDVPKAHPCGICTLGMIHCAGGKCGHYTPSKKGWGRKHESVRGRKVVHGQRLGKKDDPKVHL